MVNIVFFNREILNFFRRKTVEKDDDSAGDVIRTEYEKLGKMRLGTL